MHYKTIVHELLQQRTELHEKLRLTRRLRPTLETCAKQLKASYEAWKESLSRLRPGSDQIQIASEALEIAVQELQDRLSSDPDEQNEQNEPPSLDRAMDYVKTHTLPD